MRRSILLAICTLIAASLTAGMTLAAGATDAPDGPSEEAQFVTLINQDRQANGAQLLTPVAQIVGNAREHSLEMVAAGTIFHPSDLGAGFPAGWTKVGENVGMGKFVGVTGLHQAFMNSPHHRDNILDPVYNYVGIGVEHSSDGTMYVTEQFMAGPPDLGATQSAPPDTHIASVTGPPSLPKNDWFFAEGYTGPG